MQLILIHQESGGYEFRVKSLTEELIALKASLQDRESTIAKLRIEVHESTDRASQSLAQVYSTGSLFQSETCHFARYQVPLNKFKLRSLTFLVIQSYETRLKTLMEELSAVRKSLIDKDAELSQLRLQIHDATSKIIVVKVVTQQIRITTIN